MNRREFIAGIGGAALALAPDLARTQVQAPAVIGYLTGTPEKGERMYTSTLYRGLNSQGFVEGRNIEVIFRSAEGHYDQLPRLAAELVRRQVAVIFATGGAGHDPTGVYRVAVIGGPFGRNTSFPGPKSPPLAFVPTKKSPKACCFGQHGSLPRSRVAIRRADLTAPPAPA